MTLDELGLKYDTDKSSQDHDYLVDYEKVFNTLNIQSLLEIGIFKGGSIRALAEFLPNTKIVGTDIDDQYLINEGNIKSLNISQRDIQSMIALQLVYDFDVIIDDGSHYWGDQLLSFLTLFPGMKSGSVYIIEDIHTSFHSFYDDNNCNPLNIFGNWRVFNLIRDIREVGKHDYKSRSVIIWRK